MGHLSHIFCAALLAVFLGTLAPTSALAQEPGAAISLSPVRYDPARPVTRSYYIYDANPSREVSDEVRVRNNGTVPGTVRLYAVDGMTSNISGTAFHKDEDSREGVGTWVRLAQPELTLSPGEERIVPFTVTIPTGARGGHHLGGLVAEDTAIRVGTSSGALQVNTSHRTIVAIQVNLPGPLVERVGVTGVTTSGSAGKQALILGLRNEGSEMVKPHGELVMSDAQGQEVQRRSFKLDTFLPQTAIQYPVEVDRQVLGAGNYHAAIQLAYGANGVTQYEGEFAITQAQVAQVFPSAAPVLAPPPVAATGAPAAPVTTNATAQAQWPLFVGGGALLVLALVGGIFLGRRGRSGNAAK